MPEKIGWKQINRQDLEIIREEINRHERILKEMLRLLENLSEKIEKIKESPQTKIKSKKGEG